MNRGEENRDRPNAEPREAVPGKMAEETREAATNLLAFFRGVLGIGWKSLESAATTAERVDELTSPLPSDAVAGAPVELPEETSREDDRDLDPRSAAVRERRERWGSFFVFCAFAAAIAGGIGFLFIYWTGGNNLLLGGTVALSLGGLGSGLVLWSHWLISHKEAIAPREIMPSREPELEAAMKVYRSGKHPIHRRSLLQWMGWASVGVLASAVISLIRSLATSPNTTLYSTVWTRGERLMTIDGKPINAKDLTPKSTVTVFPEGSLGSERAQAVLMRVEPQVLQLPADRANWAPQGCIAYSRVCTHAGCPVGLYESENNLLLCPCHQSTFDVLRGAKPTGGPAARPLPQLPLYIDEKGFLHAAGGFSEPPGPGFWGMPS